MTGYGFYIPGPGLHIGNVVDRYYSGEQFQQYYMEGGVGDDIGLRLGSECGVFFLRSLTMNILVLNTCSELHQKTIFTLRTREGTISLPSQKRTFSADRVLTELG